jgi:hypothetical protein
LAKKKTDLSQLSTDLVARQKRSIDFLRPIIDTWADKENLFEGVRADSGKSKGQISDGSLTTLVVERAARVMSQLQTGQVKERGIANSGRAHLLNSIFNDHVIPNATSERPFLVKLRQWKIGAGIYGSYPMMYGTNIRDGQAYADCWLVKPRNFFPQPGKLSVTDMDWCMLSTFVTKGQLQSIADKEETTWDKDAINKLLKEIGDSVVSASSSSDGTRMNAGEQRKAPQPAEVIELVTNYESGDKGMWTTFAPDYSGIILRHIPNPHKNGKIPIVLLETIPLFDSIYGLSDFDRGMPVQKAIDSFLNLGHEKAKLETFPILKVNPSGVTGSTMKFKPNAIWKVSDMNAIEPFTTGNTALNYFQASISNLRGILLNQNGTTDTMLNAKESNNPQFGKTPQAVQAQTSRQNARDNWDTTMIDIAYEQLAEGMLDVVLSATVKPIELQLSNEELIELIEKFPEIEELVTMDGDKVFVKKTALRGKYQYMVDPGTSVEADDSTEHQALTEILTTVISNPQIAQMVADNGKGYQVMIGELFKKWMISSGTKDWDDVLKPLAEAGMQGQVEGIEDPSMQPQMPQQSAPQQGPQDPYHQQFVNTLIQDPNAAIQMLQGGQNGR